MAIVVANVRDKVPGEYVGRPARGRKGSPLGNPFVLDRDGDRATVIAKYEEWFNEQIRAGEPRVTDELDRLAALYRETGALTLLCWCAPLPCHAEVVARAVERRAKR